MRSIRHRWIDIAGLIVALAAAGALMFALLPQQTLPGQRVVPPLPASASNPTQAFLTIFIVMTTVGAPVTLAIVLALVVRWASRHVPASSAAADASTRSTKANAKPAAESRAAAPLSAGEARLWKIVATVLSVGIVGGVLIALWPDLVRLFSH